MAVTIQKALDTGLKVRDANVIAEDMMTWDGLAERVKSIEENPPLPAERESELLDTWHKQ